MSSKTLTLTLSHPMGEGTASVRLAFSQPLSGNYRASSREKNGRRFALSHRMGEGRGEGRP